MSKFQEILKNRGMQVPEPKKETHVEDPNKNNPPKNDTPPHNEPPKNETQKTDPPKQDPPKTNESTSNQFDWGTVSEEQFFNRLTEKANREIKSWEDLAPQTIEKEVEKIVPQELAPEVDAFNKFHQDTGRGFNDFVRTQKDWSTESEDVKLRGYLAEQHPELSRDDINFLFEDTYGIPDKLEGDEYTDVELRANASAIRKAEIFRKQDASKAEKFFEESRKKYSEPIEQKNNEIASRTAAGKEAWTNSVNSAMGSIKGINQDGFDYSFKDIEAFGKSSSSIEGIMGRYKNDAGELDHGKLLKTLLAGEQIADILKDHKNFVEASVVKDQLREKANESTLNQDPNKQEHKNEGFDALAHHRATLKKSHGKGMRSKKR